MILAFLGRNKTDSNIQTQEYLLCFVIVQLRHQPLIPQCWPCLVEQLQQFAKNTWHPSVFAKIIKTASNKLAKLFGNFVSLAKFPLHLANMPSPPSLGITCIPICQLVLPTCWRLNFVILAKILGCQILLPNPNSKLLEKASFFTWHLVLRLGKTIDLQVSFNKLLELKGSHQW